MSKTEQTSDRRPVSADSPFETSMRAFPTGLEVQTAIQRGRRLQAQAILGLFSRLGK